jgi:hypothetical protein
MCRTKGGHWRLRKPRRRQEQQFSSSPFSPVARLTHFLPDSQPLRFPPGEEWERLKKSLVADALPRLMLLASQHDKAYHDKALKLAWLYAGITDEDVHDVLLQPDPLTRTRNRAALKKRDYRKWQLLCQRKFAVGQPPYIKLLMKVEFLRANGAKGVRSLASALGISVSTLYRPPYGRNLVRQACQERPFRDRVPDFYRYEING